MPHATNPKFMQDYFGVTLKGKALISHAAKNGWDYLKAHYHYFDKRSKALSHAYLEQVCSKSQKVHLKHNLKHAGGSHGNSKERG